MTRRSTPKGKPGRMPTNPVDPPLQRRRLIAAGVLLPVLIVGAIPFLTSSPWAPPPTAAPSTIPTVATQLVSPAATYVGASTCKSCHESEYQSWSGSHHQLAMQEATAVSVLGDFANTTFRKDGVASSFFKRGDKFMVRTDGPDGQLTDYEVSHTFGIYPLQQYLIPFPGGRYQVLPIAWDARSKGEGGQRWFHLYPNGHCSCGHPG